MTTDLSAPIATALAGNPARVQRLEIAGQTIWIKRRESLSPLRRLQKGNAARAFEAERHALHHLAALDLPVPRILDEGPDHIALADSGTALDRILLDGIGSDAARLTIFAAAGRALADLHRHGISHGRPALKDICWDGTRITFLDFERYAEHRNTPKGHAMDVVMFVFNGFATGRGTTPEMARAIEAYRAHDPGGLWTLAQAWCARMGWIDTLTRPLQARPGTKAREFKAIPLTLAAFAAD
ncbi:phosphotransferase [Oceaniglobus indicus]|uniref:phosphotransferase n=1 Tax=Oceaniglobus indicus TaxID=2047749 RepID=UPI000C197AA6|nr:phosphotransferase [Oceaniglobus indicus]